MPFNPPASTSNSETAAPSSQPKNDKAKPTDGSAKQIREKISKKLEHYAAELYLFQLHCSHLLTPGSELEEEWQKARAAFKGLEESVKNGERCRMG